MISRARALSRLSVLVLASSLAASAAIIGPLNGGGFVIPDNNPTGASSTINNATGGTITDVTVAIDFGSSLGASTGHSWIGDLIVTLEFDGAIGTLFHRVGSTSGASAGDSDNLLGLYTFNDSFTGDLWVASDLANPIPAGNYFPSACCAGAQDGPAVPSNLNSSFAGLDAAGAWTLRISDNAGGDTGGIVGWTLTLQTREASVPEPGTVSLLALGLLALGVAGKRRLGR